MQLNQKQLKKLEKVKKLLEGGDIALLTYLMEIEDKLEEEIPSIKDIISRVKGDKGDTYELSDNDRKDIAELARSLFDDDAFATRVLNMVDIPLDKIAKEASKLIKIPNVKVDVKAIAKEASKLVEVENGKDGLDADEQKVIAEVTKNIENNLPQFGTSFRDGLELLQDDERLDVSAIKGLEELVKKDNKGKYIVGGSRVLTQLLDVNIQSPTNGQVLTYNATSKWWENQNATGSSTVNTDGTLSGDGSIGSPLGLNLMSSNVWQGTTYFNANTPVYINSGTDYLAGDIDILQIGDSSGTSLRFRWASIFGSGGNEFRLDDTAGVLQPLYVGNLTSDNVYTGAVTASSTIDGTTITASIGFAGTWAGNTIPVSRGGTGTGTTFSQNSIVLAGVSGNYTEDTGFIFNQTTKRLLISNSSTTPQNQLHLHQSGATAIYGQMTNSATDSTSTDGFRWGIDTSGIVEFRNYENTAINIYTLNTLRATYASSASPRYTVFGGIEAQYNGLANVSTDGLLVSNTTSATSVVPIQRSGRLHFLSNVWDTGATATRVDDWIIEPTLTSGNPATSVLTFARQYNSGGYTNLMTLGSDGFLKLIPSGAGGSGTNRTLDFGNGFANPAIYLYNAGATTRHGWGMQAGAMQFFQPTTAGNIFTWNAGGDLQATGTNELMRLQQFASGKAGLSIPGAGGAFAATSPYKVELDGESLAGGSAGVEDIIRFRRGQTGGVSYPEAFAIGIGRYSSSGTGPDTRVDFNLKSTAVTNYTADAGVMSLNSNKRVLIGDVGAATATVDIVGSTTSASSLRVRSGTAPTSPNEGDIWNDSTQKALISYVDGVKQNLDTTLFTQTASVTVANTVTETTLVSTGIGTVTLPANFFVAGKTIQVAGFGYNSSTANPNIRIRIKLGSTTILDTGAISSGNSSNNAWIIDGIITCRTTGATGTVIGQGYFEEVHGVGAKGGMVNTATTTIDTTASQALNVTVEWGTASASNTITLTNLILKVLN